jgi:hypothetical protein
MVLGMALEGHLAPAGGDRSKARPVMSLKVAEQELTSDGDCGTSANV